MHSGSVKITASSSVNKVSLALTRVTKHVGFGVKFPVKGSDDAILSRFPQMARSVLEITLVEGEFMAQKRKVMLIEDHEDCRGILATMTLLTGYEVILTNGDVAYETANATVV